MVGEHSLNLLQDCKWGKIPLLDSNVYDCNSFLGEKKRWGGYCFYLFFINISLCIVRVFLFLFFEFNLIFSVSDGGSFCAEWVWRPQSDGSQCPCKSSCYWKVHEKCPALEVLKICTSWIFFHERLWYFDFESKLQLSLSFCLSSWCALKALSLVASLCNKASSSSLLHLSPFLTPLLLSLLSFLHYIFLSSQT